MCVCCSAVVSLACCPVSSLMYLLNDEEINDDLHTIFKGRGHHFAPRATHLQTGVCVCVRGACCDV